MWQNVTDSVTFCHIELRSMWQSVTESVTLCHMERSEERLDAAELADRMLARGVSSLTTERAAALLGVPPGQVRNRLNAPMRRGAWVHPLNSLWVPVPPEFRDWGAPPGIEIVDLLMRHLGVEYYVGWLAAAEIYGAAHHAPQVFQVAVSRRVRDLDVGRTSFKFMTRSRCGGLPTRQWRTRAGAARVATPELTLLDVATDVSAVGGLNNAANVIVELAEAEPFSVADLANLVEMFPVATFRRAGWILETYGEGIHLDELADIALRGPHSLSRLDPSRSLSGPVDARWRLRLNATVEPDL
ncbi:type IV toxin-antitoxin system AbiEi family antitoxin domain-containing protein [Myceligenerans crystallogenes]|uniref:AbiEi antitoxin C-terminal domain-containing protein n=1 Tax=Myceligenerans crystallogenes TaxID=316335 RepID=A0ABN2NMA5_9MICO